jgi:hypothetical protein
VQVMSQSFQNFDKIRWRIWCTLLEVFTVVGKLRTKGDGDKVYLIHALR